MKLSFLSAASFLAYVAGLIKRSNIKGYEMVPWLFMCLSTPFPSIWFTAHSVSKPVSAPNLPKSDITHSPLLALRPADLPPEFIVMGHCSTQWCHSKRQGTSIFILHCTHLLHSHTGHTGPSSFTFKTQAHIEDY